MALAEHRGFSRAELVQLARHGFELALVDDATQEAWLAELADIDHD
ncbi:MAG: hypothetical protein J6386_19415 [Candidatus Synoicihabitans palmerolidicus]|nr:hypothetical protein [Candidatus Synoicihabitans palmerolidicus]